MNTPAARAGSLPPAAWLAAALWLLLAATAGGQQPWAGPFWSDAARLPVTLQAAPVQPLPAVEGGEPAGGKHPPRAAAEHPHMAQADSRQGQAAAPPAPQLALDASGASQPLPPTAEDYEALLARLETLEQQLARPPAETKKADEGKRPGDGWIDLSTERWTVKLGGHIQLDYVNWADAAPGIPDTKDYFEFRRLRLVADGLGYGVYDFRLQMTLEPETVGESPPGSIMSPDVKDAYFTLNEVPGLQRVRIGNFFVPFSLEQVTNDTNNIFLERSIPTQGVFAADREVGVAVYGASEAQDFTWSFGMFLDSISEGLKERIDDNQGYRTSSRLTWLPYYDEPSHGRYLVHAGIGLLHTEDQDKRVRFRARPQIHEGPRLIDSGVLDASSYTTGNLEAAVVWGQVTVQSEAFLSHVNMLGDGTDTVNGAYVHLSYFLTGENRVYERWGQHGAQFGRNVPYTNVFATPGGCGWGAWELKARFSRLDLGNVNAGEYDDLTLGCNWYWSDRVRVMFDWIHPVTSRGAVFGATQSDLLGLRFDCNW